MVQISTLLVALIAASVSLAAPASIQKRINQDTPSAKAKWEAACDKATNNNPQCNAIAVPAAVTLLAGADVCAQQDSADAMIDFAKSTGKNDPDMIKFAQIFAQQPRNSPNSVSIPYCQKAPKNAELKGLFQCQFSGVKSDEFVTTTGDIPFGQSAPLNPAGSCAAHPAGPIPDGQQLSDIVDSPGVPGAPSSGAKGGDNSGSATEKAASAAATPTAASGTKDASATDSADDSAATAPAASSGSGGFQLSNGQAAQKLNKSFASITAGSSCTSGQQACINGSFAQCDNGKFAITGCAAGTTCAALPLVNKAGTSIACTTTADATARIAATGAKGGLTGSD